MNWGKRLFGNIPDEPVTSKDLEEPEDKLPQRITGKIIHLAGDKGWGFISSHEIQFTRIFFHWTGLNQDTLHFTELARGMKVEFTPKWFDDQGWRAIKIQVLEKDDNDSKTNS